MYSHRLTYAIMNPNFISVKCITKGILLWCGRRWKGEEEEDRLIQWIIDYGLNGCLPDAIYRYLKLTGYLYNNLKNLTYFTYVTLLKRKPHYYKL